MDDKTNMMKIDLSLAPPTDVSVPDAAAQKLFVDARSGVVEIKSGNASATGFVVRDDKTVITNAHCVLGSRTIEVYDSLQHKNWKAKVRDLDDINDLAVLEIVTDQPRTSSR